MEKLFLSVMAPVIVKKDGIYIESQTYNGILRWSDNFEAVTVMLPELHYSEDENYYTWTLVTKEEQKNRNITIIPVPPQYRLIPFIHDVMRFRKIIRAELKNSTYNVLSIGGLAGDWGAIAGVFSIMYRYKYAIWTDRVEHNVILKESTRKIFIKRFYNRIFIYNALKYYHRFIIKKADLGLFHGNDCLMEYSKINRKPHLVYNLHLKEEDQISEDRLKEKLINLAERKSLKICYAGRMTEMKGPFEWLAILKLLKEQNVNFKAVWMGDGDLLPHVQNKIDLYDLNSEIQLTGYIKDMEIVKKTMQGSDVFLFCHKTKESPRSLIEALKSACPIVGFHSEYPEDLIKKHGGGKLIKNFSIEKTVKVLEGLSRDRRELAKITENSYKDGLRFSDKWVFKHRSDIVKRELA